MICGPAPDLCGAGANKESREPSVTLTSRGPGARATDGDFQIGQETVCRGIAPTTGCWVAWSRTSPRKGRAWFSCFLLSVDFCLRTICSSQDALARPERKFHHTRRYTRGFFSPGRLRRIFKAFVENPVLPGNAGEFSVWRRYGKGCGTIQTDHFLAVLRIRPETFVISEESQTRIDLLEQRVHRLLGEAGADPARI